MFGHFSLPLMISCSYLKCHPELWQYVIGIKYSQFEFLLPKFSRALRQSELSWLKQPRLKQPGQGRKPTLRSDFDKLFFVLFYYKIYPTFRFAQILFGLDKRNCQIWVRRLEIVLKQTVDYQLALPKRKVSHFRHWFEVCPQLKEFIVDCSERLIQRPNKTNQEFYYSGKKKHHTVKNQILVNPRNKKILAVSDTMEGKRHDKQVFASDLLFLKFPPGSKGLGDSAYQGVHHPFFKILTPTKKPPGQELTEMDKNNNKSISQIRVRVEHPLAYLKHFNILSQKFRSRIPKADLPFKNIACLYNFSRNYG